MEAKKWLMSWEEFETRLLSLRLKIASLFRLQDARNTYTRPIQVFGVPRGGMIVAGFMVNDPCFRNECTPERAEIIIDDIIDSGRTRLRFEKMFPGKPFFALVDKRGEDKDCGWVVFPWETDEETSIEDAVIRQIQFVGEDPDREGLRDTPKRVARSWKELCSGYGSDPTSILKTFEDVQCDEMVLLKDIEIYSTCEHHLLPFFGKAHVAYIPDGKVVGISKLARLVEVFARRLQIQERIGEQVTSTLMGVLKPKGAACIIEAKHLCMTSRGVQKQNSVMRTSSLKGVFLDKPAARAELMTLIGG